MVMATPQPQSMNGGSRSLVEHRYQVRSLFDIRHRYTLNLSLITYSVQPLSIHPDLKIYLNAGEPYVYYIILGVKLSAGTRRYVRSVDCRQP